MKSYFYISSLRTTSFISIRKQKELLFASSIRNDVAGNFHATHVVFEADNWKGENSLRIPNEKVRDFIKETGLKLIGLRLGCTKWQGKSFEKDKKKVNEYCKKELKKTGWDPLELAENCKEYQDLMK